MLTFIPSFPHLSLSSLRGASFPTSRCPISITTPRMGYRGSSIRLIHFKKDNDDPEQSSPSDPSGDIEKDPIPGASLGKFLLLFVPLLWASYPILVKVLYRLPWAISPPLFNCVRLVIATLCLAPWIRFRKPLLLAGSELGFYTVVTNILQFVALRHTTASQAAFLTQLSTVMVPFVTLAIGMEVNLPWNVLAAVPLSVMGVGLLTLSKGITSLNLKGDGLMLIVACIATTYIIRSKQFSKQNAVQLVAVKTLFQMLFSVIYFALQRPTLTNMFVGATPLFIFYNVLIILWAGIFIGFISTIIQMRGQRLVSASQASVIFASIPLWAALLAVPLGERLGGRGWAGAASILVATLLASGVGKQRKTPKQNT